MHHWFKLRSFNFVVTKNSQKHVCVSVRIAFKIFFNQNVHFRSKYLPASRHLHIMGN